MAIEEMKKGEKRRNADEGDEAEEKLVADAPDDDDEEIGPMPAPEASHKKKKARVLAHEKLYLDNLPSSDMYERSLMHRDVINFVEVANKTDFLITTSVDGHVKFWKKSDKGIEFVKHFRAHMGAIVAVATSHDGTLFATAGADKALKIFDIVNFDMINMFKLSYLPNALCWCFKREDAQAILACSDLENSNIYLYDGRDSNKAHNGSAPDDPLATISTIHSEPVHLMRYHPGAQTVVSIDKGGMVEYWEPELNGVCEQPKIPKIDWTYKSETDLYEFKKAKTVPTSLTLSPDLSKFATFGFGDRQIRVFNFRTGKLIRKYDESLTVVAEMQQAGTASYKLDDMEFRRRVAREKELEKKGGQSLTVNAVFDETGNFLIYPSLLGIKIVNIETNKVSRLLGRTENYRFMNLALYQGAPKKKSLVTYAMAASDNTALKESEAVDPSLFCTAYDKNRFFMFTKRDPNADESSLGPGQSRDIFNEKPSREEQTVASMSQSNLKASLGSQAIIHTSHGDIHIRLFPEHAPKAVENFVGLAKKGYYDNVLFHRVIQGFMIQTGDPFGDGTGGESLWGYDFEDEFSRSVKHDRPYTVSMANCGPNTNGSQFFITTVPTPWLDNKHTVFGRATGGMDVVHLIEKAKTDKNEKPLDDIKILNIEVR
ncbi:Peptidyl-prolyl cis-trans isomerase cyp15 [Dinochytrium kinnereticum]|nr:Peptidyl-prolyl cis-trans isomerase cyp15 [Dinochytrium kinnereticum]